MPHGHYATSASRRIAPRCLARSCCTDLNRTLARHVHEQCALCMRWIGSSAFGNKRSFLTASHWVCPAWKYFDCRCDVITHTERERERERERDARCERGWAGGLHVIFSDHTHATCPWRHPHAALPQFVRILQETTLSLWHSSRVVECKSHCQQE